MSETPVPADVPAEEEDVKSPTYTPIFVTLERESTTDSFGIWIGATNDGRQVVTKVEGDMAKVLLKVGDEIMAIDNSPVSSMFSHPDLPAVLNHDSLMERIGAATTMKLTILREDSDEEEDIPEVYRRMTVSEAGNQAPAEIIREGQLQKKGASPWSKSPSDVKKSWKSRWFVMYAKSIAYLDKKGGKVKGGILFEDANLVRDATELEAGKKEHCFVIELPHRHYVISASSPEEKVEWKVDIAKILLGLGKDPDAKSQPVVPKVRSAPGGMAGGMAMPKVPDMPDATLSDAGLPDAKLPGADVKVPDVTDVAADDEAEAVEEEEAVDRIVGTMTVSQAGNEAPAEIIREAALAKKGGVRTSWKSRWFVMYTKSIAYLDKKGGKVKGGILFEDANLVRDATELEAGKKEHCFVIELPHRHYVISASSPEEKVEWKADIAKVLLGLGKDPDAKSQPVKPKARSVPGSMAMPPMKMPDMPDAKMPDAKMPDAKMPDAKMPDAKMPDMPGTDMPDLPGAPLPKTGLPHSSDLTNAGDAALPAGITDEEAEAIEEEEDVEEVVRRMTVSQAGKEAPAEIIREGEMAKKGKKLKGWKTRWFVLYATSIANLDKKDGKVKGGILFEDVTLVRDATELEAGKKEHCLAIELPHRHHLMSASSPEEKDGWKADIAKILLGLGKDPNAESKLVKESKPVKPKTRGMFSSLKLPSWKTPGLPDAPDVELPDAEVPEIDVDVPEGELPDVQVPNADVNVPTTELPEIKVPDVDVTLPDPELPGVDADLGVDDTSEAIEEVVRRMTVSKAGNEAPAEIIREGEMAKTGGAWKSWKTRWFVMYTKSIAYLDKKGGKVKGGILFEDANLVRDATELEAGKKEHCFVIELPHRHYVISASSPEEKVEWKADIAKILLGLGKDPDAKSQPATPKVPKVGGMKGMKMPTGPDMPETGLPDAKLPSATD